MAISPKNQKILWANAAGCCSFRNCGTRLTESNENNTFYLFGEMAHICGEKEGANRYNPYQSDKERDDYKNLILLCPTHHSVIDKIENEKEYDVELLHQMKASHEKSIANALASVQIQSKYELTSKIYPLMLRNYECFINYGPKSELARRNPQSSNYKLWLTERLATIVPNNRKMYALLENNLSLFDGNEQAVIEKFFIHVRGYDAWVKDEVSYEGIVRFPGEFEVLIKKLSNASNK